MRIKALLFCLFAVSSVCLTSCNANNGNVNNKVVLVDINEKETNVDYYIYRDGNGRILKIYPSQLIINGDILKYDEYAGNYDFTLFENGDFYTLSYDRLIYFEHINTIYKQQIIVEEETTTLKEE